VVKKLPKWDGDAVSNRWHRSGPVLLATESSTGNASYELTLVLYVTLFFWPALVLELSNCEVYSVLLLLYF
jgi:hypothetical protein